MLCLFPDLKKSYDQLHMWVKHGMVPTFKDDSLERENNDPVIAQGSLSTVWMGGLVNPTALLTALRQEKAIISHCGMDEVTILFIFIMV